jgi:mRNA-degrading endonuclease RelE of RelBE toxin-antitoxin system
MPSFRVIAHRRVQSYLNKIRNKKLKDSLIETLLKLEDYPSVLRELDIETVKGLEKTFRIRRGNHRIIFYVDKTEKTIYVTHLDARKRIYKK